MEISNSATTRLTFLRSKHPKNIFIGHLNVNGTCESNSSCAEDLRKIRKNNFRKLIFAHLNINSIRNKFDTLANLVKGNIDILMISETKVDDSFPRGQFFINGFSAPFRLDRNKNGGGIMLFIREDIPATLKSIENPPIEAFFVELTIKKKKWLLSCNYNNHNRNLENHLSALAKSLDSYVPKYDHFLILGDFNSKVTDKLMKEFCENYNLKSLINVPTCYKNPERPTCIDLCLTNSPRNFQSSCVVETGLSDFHKMTIIVNKSWYQKLDPRVINYRDYKRFSNQSYLSELTIKLSHQSFEDDDPSKFLNVCLSVLNQHAPRKKKFVRGNQAPFMNKNFSKATMIRSKLRNYFLKNKSEESRVKYTKQRNYCVSLLRKTKKDYYSNLNVRDICDNKKFWSTVKPFLSDKIKNNEKTTLIENDNIANRQRF